MTLEERVAAELRRTRLQSDAAKARAAIAAVMEHLREVTPEMGSAGEDHVSYYDETAGIYSAEHIASQTYLAMLETAIK